MNKMIVYIYKDSDEVTVDVRFDSRFIVFVSDDKIEIHIDQSIDDEHRVEPEPSFSFTFNNSNILIESTKNF